VAGNLGLFGGQSSALLMLKECTLSRLANISPELVVRTGLQVAKAVATFKETKPELVPTVPGGLLGPSAVPLDDFLIAEKLFDESDLVAALRVANKTAGPELLSYIATVFSAKDDPSPQWVDSALRYVLNKVISTNTLYENLATGIQEKLNILKPVAEHGKKFKARKLDSIGPLARAVRKHLRSDMAASAEQVWTALAARSPKGLTFIDSTTPSRRRVEYDRKTHKGNLKDTSYRAFENAVSKQRKALQDSSNSEPVKPPA
jgi:hypothetical protein